MWWVFKPFVGKIFPTYKNLPQTTYYQHRSEVREMANDKTPNNQKNQNNPTNRKDQQGPESKKKDAPESKKTPDSKY